MGRFTWVIDVRKGENRRHNKAGRIGSALGGGRGEIDLACAGLVSQGDCYLIDTPVLQRKVRTGDEVKSLDGKGGRKLAADRGAPPGHQGIGQAKRRTQRDSCERYH